MKKGRPTTSWFRLYDIETGDLVVEGTSKDCGKAIGAGEDAIRQAYQRTLNSTYKGYQIEGIQKVEANSDAEAIKNWDAFVEPLRKKYGIPVRRMKVEDKKNGK